MAPLASSPISRLRSSEVHSFGCSWRTRPRTARLACLLLLPCIGVHTFDVTAPGAFHRSPGGHLLFGPGELRRTQRCKSRLSLAESLVPLRRSGSAEGVADRRMELALGRSASRITYRRK